MVRQLRWEGLNILLPVCPHAGRSYDGRAPAAYWFGSPSTEPRDIRDQGFRLNDMRLERSYNGEDVSGLEVWVWGGVCWDD